MISIFRSVSSFCSLTSENMILSKIHVQKANTLLTFIYISYKHICDFQAKLRFNEKSKLHFIAQANCLFLEYT